MKTKWNLLIILFFVVGLVGGNVTLVRAETGPYISPATLPGGTVGTAYKQQLSLEGGTKAGNWQINGYPPDGLFIHSESGEMEGNPTSAGTFNFTVLVHDYYDPLDNTLYNTYTRDYSMIIDKGTPTVILVDDFPTTGVGDEFLVTATTQLSVYTIPGAVDFYLDDAATPVTGCTALHLAEYPGYVDCVFPKDISAGAHAIKAVFHPADSTNLYDGEATTIHTLKYYISGTLFNDDNGNGILDEGETPIQSMKVGLDKDCDTTIDQEVWSSYEDGTFYTDPLDTNVNYCLKYLNTFNGNVQTTPAEPIVLVNANKNVPVGVYSYRLQFDPDSLPQGKPNTYYEQQITVSGGKAPYAITLDASNTSLPTGMSFDTSTGILSGTPTQYGPFKLAIKVVDGWGSTFTHVYDLTITLDGSFLLTSDHNPSADGQEVTFTLSATGDAVIPGYGTVPPVGYVSFYDGDTPIDNCSGIILNANMQTYTIGDIPAVCKTSALSTGVHTIKAVYADIIQRYSNATTTLTQRVGVPSDTTPPTIELTIQGTQGQNNWYTGEVSLTWTVTDPESAFTSSGCDPVTITSDQAMTDYTCSATSAGGTASKTVSIARDATAPVVNVTGVSEGASYPRGSLPAAGCTTTDALSGVASQASLSLSGGDAQGLGSFTAVCSGAADNAGNAANPVSVHYIVVASADLSVTKTDSKDPIKPGAQLAYTLTVSNAGPDAAQSLTLVDMLDKNTTFASVAASSGWTCKYANGKVTCTAGSLTSGRSAIIKITVTVSKTAKLGKELVNNASVSSKTFDPVLTNNTVVQKTMVSK